MKKKLLLVTLSVTFGVLLVGCGDQIVTNNPTPALNPKVENQVRKPVVPVQAVPTQATQPVAIQPAQQQVANQNPVATQTDNQNLVYENAKYGFKMNFSEEWKNYSVKEEPVGNFRFYYNKNNQGLAFSISTWKINEWNEHEKQCAKDAGAMGCLGKDTFLGKNSNYAFEITMPNDDLIGVPMSTNDVFSMVKKNFSLTK